MIGRVAPYWLERTKSSVDWGETKHILCIYAPTSDSVEERRAFFEQLCKYYEEHPGIPRPHIMASDFNNVEDAADRMPLGEGMMVADGWRVTHPTERDFTFHRGTGPNAVFSSLDRIYMTASMFDHAREWRISEAGVRTDHSLVSVVITSSNAPAVGPGRPVFPQGLLRDKKLSKNIKSRGMEALAELRNIQDAGE
ncbi:hypothetical protein C8Q74DRAFT_1319684 [Fomes fomentarius]|nr:hypothetical protein C8Q74DRAFT_1319684 [Fomes fomentarius]